MHKRIRRLAYETARAIPSYPYVPAGIGAVVALLSIPPHLVGWPRVSAVFLAAGLAVVLAVTGWWFRHECIPLPPTTKGFLARRDAYAQRHGGTASRLDIAQYASAARLRMDAHVLRPQKYGDVSSLARRRIPVTDLGVELVHLGPSLIPGGRVIYSRSEDVTVRIGGTRKGKTGSLIPYGLTAPGALVTTSTRLDVAEWVHPVRSDRAVHVWNPSGSLPVASTVRWPVLSGCTNYDTAARRAEDLIPVVRTDGEAATWDKAARDLLGLYLHGAALTGRRCLALWRWIADPGEGRAEREVLAALERAPLSEIRIEQARAHFATTERTRSGVTHSMKKALAWTASDTARQLGDPDPGTETFDAVRFIEQAETLHLLGEGKADSILAPLNTALVGEIAWQADKLARHSKRGRLDPAVTMLLDEAAIVCPCPLPRWTADKGGAGITIHVSVQSLAQLRHTYGDEGAGIILGNCGALMVFGGGKGATDLTEISTLVGEARQRVQGTKKDDPDAYRFAPVLSPREISALPDGVALVFARDLRPVVGETRLVWDIRGTRQADLTAVEIPETVPEDLAERAPARPVVDVQAETEVRP